MADDSDEDKTEEPTEKRLADAIERGNTPVSREIAFLTSIAAYLLIELYALPSATPELVAALTRFLDDPAGWRLQTSGDAVLLGRALAESVARFLGPSVLLLLAFGLGGSIFQNAPRIVPRRIAPDFKRLSPISGFARLFGPRGWTEFGKSALKLGLARLVIAGADFTWTRIHWRRDQRMSRHELREEIKQAEGDRMLKARLRSLRLDRSRRNMMKAVPKATMVIVNPTHYAVAMRYVRSDGGAPVVLAKGVDLIALKIREIAFDNNIPVIEDKPLARSLYEAVAVDAVIPPEFYRAVAEIVQLIQSKRSAWPISRRRLN